MKRANLYLSGERVFNFFNVIFLTLITFIIVFPLWNVVVNSFSSAAAVADGKSIFWPGEFSLSNYQAVFQDGSIWSAFGISVLKTVLGVIGHVFFCAMVAYGMSKQELRGRKLYTVMGVITMFFSGGMIPTYLLIKNLGLLNNFFVYIIPALFSYYDMIILMNFFRQVPASLEESARMDGANSMTDNAGSLEADLQNFLGVPIENEDGTWYDRNMDEDYLAWRHTLNGGISYRDRRTAEYSRQ